MAVLQKQLAGAEDVLLGQGKVTQNRNGIDYQISKLNAALIPYSGDVVTANFVSIANIIDSISSAVTPLYTVQNNTDFGSVQDVAIFLDEALPLSLANGAATFDYGVV